MLKYIFLTGFSLAILFQAVALPTDLQSPGYSFYPKDSSRAFREECIKILKELNPSLTGKTPRGNNYSLFAIKRGKEWTYLILDSTGYYSIKQVKDKDEMEENPQTYTEMLCLMTKANMIRRFNKPVNVSGLTFSCYYKFRPKAKKMYKTFNYISRNVQFIQKSLKGGKASGVNKILKKYLK